MSDYCLNCGRELEDSTCDRCICMLDEYSEPATSSPVTESAGAGNNWVSDDYITRLIQAVAKDATKSQYSINSILHYFDMAQSDLTTANERIRQLERQLQAAGGLVEALSIAVKTSYALVKSVDGQLDTMLFNVRQMTHIEPERVTRSIEGIREYSAKAVIRLANALEAYEAASAGSEKREG